VNNHLKWDLARAVHAHLTGLHNNRFTALRASEGRGYSEAEKKQSAPAPPTPQPEAQVVTQPAIGAVRQWWRCSV